MIFGQSAYKSEHAIENLSIPKMSYISTVSSIITLSKKNCEKLLLHVYFARQVFQTYMHTLIVGAGGSNIEY